MGNLSLAEKRSYSTAYVQYMQKVLNMYAFYQLYIKQAVPEEFSATVTINEESKTIKSQDVTDVMEIAKSISGRLKNYQSNFNSYTRYRSYLLTSMGTEIEEDLKWFADNDIVKMLETAVTKIGDLETKITNLNTANDNLATKIKEYNGNDSGDAFSNQMQQEYEYYKENIDPQKVAALKTKLTELKNYYTEVKAYLEGLKFTDVSLKECNTLGNMVMMTRRHKTTNGSTVDEYVEAHYREGVSSIADYMKQQYHEEKTAPSKRETSIDDDEFWQYLQKAYGVTKTDEDEQAKKDKDNMKEAAKDTASTGKTNPFNNVTVPAEVIALLPSQENLTRNRTSIRRKSTPKKWTQRTARKKSEQRYIYFPSIL